MDNGHAVPPVAVIQILLMPDGAIQTQAQVKDRQMFNMMMETARQDMVARMREQEKLAPVKGVLVAPTGARVK